MQGEETFDVVPDSAFVVSRTAHRNNSSDYHIDNRRSNFTEVTRLLKGKGIDLDNNRFLILQVTADCHSCACLSFAWMVLHTTPLRKARLAARRRLSAWGIRPALELWSHVQNNHSCAQRQVEQVLLTPLRLSGSHFALMCPPASPA